MASCRASVWQYGSIISDWISDVCSSDLRYSGGIGSARWRPLIRSRRSPSPQPCAGDHRVDDDRRRHRLDVFEDAEEHVLFLWGEIVDLEATQVTHWLDALEDIGDGRRHRLTSS